MYCIVLYCIVLYYIVLYCIVLYCFKLYCITLFYIVLYCIVLYYIVLYCYIFQGKFRHRCTNCDIDDLPKFYGYRWFYMSLITLVFLLFFLFVCSDIKHTPYKSYVHGFICSSSNYVWKPTPVVWWRTYKRNAVKTDTKNKDNLVFTSR